MNLEEIKALAVYAEQSRRMMWRIEEDCTEKLNTYVRGKLAISSSALPYCISTTTI